METLKGLIANLAFILLLATFLEMLLPNNSMKGFVRLVMGFFVIAAVLQPIAGLLKIPDDTIFRAWTQGVRQAPLLPEGQSENPGKDAVREQYRKILQRQVQSVAESLSSVAGATVWVELGSEGNGYLDYPPIQKIRIDIYKSAVDVDSIDFSMEENTGGSGGVGGTEGSEGPRERSLTSLEMKVRNHVCEALQVSKDIVEVRER
jgi:stage III sporulation protein AF